MPLWVAFTRSHSRLLLALERSFCRRWQGQQQRSTGSEGGYCSCPFQAGKANFKGENRIQDRVEDQGWGPGRVSMPGIAPMQGAGLLGCTEPLTTSLLVSPSCLCSCAHLPSSSGASSQWYCPFLDPSLGNKGITSPIQSHRGTWEQRWREDMKNKLESK